MKIRYLFIAIAVSILLFVNCGVEKPRVEPTVKGQSAPVSAKLVLSDSAFALGSEITFNMVIKSQSSDSVKLMFPNACRADFVVMRDGYPIWTLLEGKSCAQVISYGRIAPLDSITIPAKWNCTTNEAKGVVLGKYTVKGLLLSNPRIETEPATFYLVD
jgi:hypothetical protein